MCFGNVPRDLCLNSLATTHSIASKSANGYFSAGQRTEMVPKEPFLT